MRLSLMVLLACMSIAGATTNYFFGNIFYDECRRQTIVRWSNTPPAIIVEYSRDLSNWTAVMILTRLDRTGLTTFEYPINTNDGPLFMRLHQYGPE